VGSGEWGVGSGEWGVGSGEWGVGSGEWFGVGSGRTKVVLQSYQELEVWQRSMTLAEECYQATKGFPREELFGLTCQIRRAAGSIPANIAEGQGRQHTKEFLNHLSIARGSLKELETHLILSQRVGLLESTVLESLLMLANEISRMMAGLRKALEQRL
jgi:four helix bundle protein